MSASPCFADTVFWYALLNRRDQYHHRAVRWKDWVTREQTPLVTTDLVLWELLNACSPTSLRAKGAHIYRRCFAEPGIEVIDSSPTQKAEGVRLFESSADKTWSFTDCVSFVVMRERGVVEALSSDHHFVQAGYRALLLTDPPN